MQSYLRNYNKDYDKNDHLCEQKMTAKLDDLLDNEKNISSNLRLSFYNEGALVLMNQ